LCCADSEKNKSLPSTPAVKDTGANQQLVAIPLANSLAVFAHVPVVESVDPAGGKTIICAQPQLAILCSFLI
jgi:hypothetical protein